MQGPKKLKIIFYSNGVYIVYSMLNTVMEAVSARINILWFLGLSQDRAEVISTNVAAVEKKILSNRPASVSRASHPPPTV